MHVICLDCLDCPNCGAVRPVEVPPCRDGHGADCPDRACAVCGAAFVVGPILPRPHREPARRAA